MSEKEGRRRGVSGRERAEELDTFLCFDERAHEEPDYRIGKIEEALRAERDRLREAGEEAAGALDAARHGNLTEFDAGEVADRLRAALEPGS